MDLVEDACRIERKDLSTALDVRNDDEVTTIPFFEHQRITVIGAEDVVGHVVDGPHVLELLSHHDPVIGDAVFQSVHDLVAIVPGALDLVEIDDL